MLTYNRVELGFTSLLKNFKNTKLELSVDLLYFFKYNYIFLFWY